ncbi:tetratricopeptide repeat protein [Phormidesmis sp. 146-33]
MLDTGRLPLTGNALSWFRQGLGHAAAEDHEKAVASYNQVLRTRPDFWEAWYERGLSLESLGFFTEAIASYDRALQSRPSREAEGEIWHDRGNAMQYGLGDYEAALICYNHTLQINEAYPLAWFNRGNALLYGLNQYDGAIESYNHAIELDANNHLTWRNRGNALVELKRYSEAIASYDRALSLQPDDQVSWQARLLASQQCGLSGLKQPTTKPVWYEDGCDATLVEHEAAPHKAVEGKEVRPFAGHPFPRLVVEDDAGQREISLEKAQYTIGRDPKNDICLRSQFASRYHAVLRRVDREDGMLVYTIDDGNVDGKPSTNGLLINGQRLLFSPLKTGDLVVFGPQVRATYHYDGLQQSE